MPLVFIPPNLIREKFLDEPIRHTLARWCHVGVPNKLIPETNRRLRYSTQGDSYVVKTTDLFEFLMGDE